ncbi:MAG: IS1 family transposase [Chloroflexi bacterium]|nr:IS1 family transposase [Chloroflexota bacterium]
MNSLPRETQLQLVQSLVTGVSIRDTSRNCHVSRETIAKYIVDLGKLSGWYQDKVMRGLYCERIEVDEIWGFVFSKDKTLRLGRAKNPPPDAGSVWTWIAIDPVTKLVPAWWIGNRTQEAGHLFLKDLHSRLASRVQLTSDGYSPYISAVEATFGGNVDFAQLVKLYMDENSDPATERLSNRAQYSGHRKDVIMGNPDPALITTAHVERLNLTLRMSVKRLTRSSNAHSKSILYHAYHIALFFMFYNFCRWHSSVGMTPAQAAGLADRRWGVVDLVDMLNEYWKARRPHTYKPRKPSPRIRERLSLN